MPSLKLNIIANFVGRGWAAIMGLAFVPLYIKFMGMEAYGLVGFSATIQALSSLLDMGLSSTLNRELAILSAQEGKQQESRDLVRTLEIIYWAATVFICLLILAISPLLADSWIKSQQLSKESVQMAIALMGIVIACQFPFSLYSGGLLGLQRQVLLNGITITMATVRGIGMILVLWLVSPTIQAFFIWQAFVSFLQTIVTASFLWRNLPLASRRPYFRKDLWINVWRFAAGMTGISLVSLILTQTDKIIISKMLTLEEFGYYNLAGTMASGITILSGPIFTSVFPRFSELVSQGEEEKLTNLYHKSCQLLSLLLLPISVTLALFSKDILLMWTGNLLIAEKTHLVASLLIVGTCLHGLMNIPYALQLAYGWTRLAFYVNVVSIVFLIPSLFWLTSYYGSIGAGIVWVVLNSIYLSVGINLIHSRLLKGEMLRWYFHDILKPLFGSLLFGCISLVLAKIVFPQPKVNIWYIALIFGLIIIGTVLTTDLTNRYLKRFLFNHTVKD
jgi:O-antigen/teichoic acid export membrane protein